MDEIYEQKYHQVEKHNWWHVARRNIVSKLVDKIPLDSKILDIGCSSGELVKLFQEKGYKNTYGVEISQEAVTLAKSKGIENIHSISDTKLPFHEEEFDVIIASDVLEHIEDEISALEEWRRILRSGGVLIIFVPAFQLLWSEHDIVNQHFRRYTKANLAKVVEQAGFKVKRKSYWNFTLFFPTVIFRQVSNWLGYKPKNTSMKGMRPWINSFLRRLVSFEDPVFLKLGFPVGVSVFVFAENPD